MDFRPFIFCLHNYLLIALFILYKSAGYLNRESNEAKVFRQNNLVGRKNINPDCIQNTTYYIL